MREAGGLKEYFVKRDEEDVVVVESGWRLEERVIEGGDFWRESRLRKAANIVHSAGRQIYFAA